MSKKRFLAWLLTLVMIIGLMPANIFAAEADGAAIPSITEGIVTEDASGTEAEAAVTDESILPEETAQEALDETEAAVSEEAEVLAEEAVPDEDAAEDALLSAEAEEDPAEPADDPEEETVGNFIVSFEMFDEPTGSTILLMNPTKVGYTAEDNGKTIAEKLLGAENVDIRDSGWMESFTIDGVKYSPESMELANGSWLVYRNNTQDATGPAEYKPKDGDVYRFVLTTYDPVTFAMPELVNDMSALYWTVAEAESGRESAYALIQKEGGASQAEIDAMCVSMAKAGQSHYIFIDGRTVQVNTTTNPYTYYTTLTADKSKASAGETVTVTVTVPDGIAMTEGSLTANGAALTKAGDTTYTFVMPDAHVTVTAEFADADSGKLQSAAFAYDAAGTDVIALTPEFDPDVTEYEITLLDTKLPKNNSTFYFTGTFDDSATVQWYAYMNYGGSGMYTEANKVGTSGSPVALRKSTFIAYGNGEKHRLDVTSAGGTVKQYFFRMTMVPTLSDLTIGGETIDGFKSEKNEYELTLEPGTTSVTLNAEPTDDNYYVYLNDGDDDIASEDTEISLAAGENIVKVVVDDDNGTTNTYTLKITVEAPAEKPQLASLVMRAASGAAAAEYPLEPAFDPEITEYTFYLPDSATYAYAWATLPEGKEGAITLEYKNPSSGAEIEKTIVSGSSVYANSLGASNSYVGQDITVKVGGEEAYLLHCVRQATLATGTVNGLNIVPEGQTAVLTLTPAYNRTVYEYDANIARNTVLNVKARATVTASATLSIDGKTTPQDTVTAVTPAWENYKYDLIIEVAGEGAKSGKYVIHLHESPSEILIVKAPDKVVYAPGETFDPTGMEVQAVYSDGAKVDLAAGDYTVSPAGALTLGDTEITISYGGAEAKQAVSFSTKFQGSGTAEDPYQIATAEDMMTLDEYVEGGESFEGTYVKVLADITLPETWNGVGTNGGRTGYTAANADSKPFGGDFDGSGHTITIPGGGKAIFDFVRRAKIHDLNVYGEKIDDYALVSTYISDSGVSSVVEFDNVTLKSGSKTLYSGFIGGYASGSNAITIKNCTIEENVIIGYDKTQSNIGGFAGEYNGTIENSVSNATVYGVNYVGGIVADKGQSMGTFKVDGCTFNGTVEATGSYVGGIVGAGYGGTRWGMSSAWSVPGVTIDNCVSTGTVKGDKGVGGIFGGEGAQAQAWEKSETYIRKNSFTGTVSGNAYVGGDIGYMLSINKNTYIEDNYYASNCGAEAGIGAVGGIDTNGHESGMIDGVFYFTTDITKWDSLAAMRDAVPGHAVENYIEIAGTSNSKTIGSTGYKTQFKQDHHRSDDPLGADAAALCRTDTPIVLEEGVFALPDLAAGPSAMFNHFVEESKLLIVEGDKATIRFITDGSTASIQKYSKIALGKSSELVETNYQATLPEGTVIIEGVLQPYDEGTGKEKYLFEITLDKSEVEAMLTDEAPEDIYITVWNKEGSSADKIPGWYKASNDIYLTIGEVGEKAEAPAAAESFHFTLQVGQYTEGSDFHYANFEGVEYSLKDEKGNIYEPSSTSTGSIGYTNLSVLHTYTFTASKEGWVVVTQGEWDTAAHAYIYNYTGDTEIVQTITKDDNGKNITDTTNPGMIFRLPPKEENEVDKALAAVPEDLKYELFTDETANALKDAIENADPEENDPEKLSAMAKAIYDALEGLIPKDGSYEVDIEKYNATPYYLYEGLGDSDRTAGKAVLVVKDGVMTANIVLKNQSYGQVALGTKDEVIEAATAAGAVPEGTIDLTMPAEKMTFNGKEYTVTTGTIPVPALQKEIAYAYHSSNTERYTYNTGWYDHAVMYLAASLVPIEPEVPKLSKLTFNSQFNPSYGVVYPMAPEFDPDVREYTVIVPANGSTGLYTQASYADGSEGEIVYHYHNELTEEGGEVTQTVESDYSYCTQLSFAINGNKLTPVEINITIGGVQAYKVTLIRQPVLSAITLTKTDESEVVLTPAFSSAVNEYMAYVPSVGDISVTAKAFSEGTALAVNGQNAESEKAVSVTPVWADRGFDIEIAVSAEGAESNNYKIHLIEQPKSLSITKEPDKTAYELAETFDPSGIEVTAVYEDGEKVVLGSEDYTFAPTAPLTAADKKITFTYKEVTVELPISVNVPFDGEGTEEDPFQIKTAEDMTKLDELVEGGETFAGAYLKVMNDITLAEGWGGVGEAGVTRPIQRPGANARPFRGNFDGGGYTLTVPEEGKAIFNYAFDCTIHNLNIYGTKIDDNALIGWYLQGSFGIVIDGVTIKEGTNTLESGFLGGYASGTNTVRIKNSTIEKGVVIGYDKQQSNIGAFAGELQGTIENCTTEATVYGINYVGGIVANKGQTMASLEVKDCVFNGTVEATGSYVGGIAGAGYGGTSFGMVSGWSTPGVDIENCESKGTVKGAKGVGGILGGEGAQAQAWDNGPTTVKNNSFTGTISGEDYVGGTIGFILSLNKNSFIEDNYYKSGTGAEAGIGAVGGIDTNGHELGMIDGVYYFTTDSAKWDSPADMRNEVPGHEIENYIEIQGTSNAKTIGSAAYKNQFKTDHQRDDDPLGADKDNLTYTDADYSAVDAAIAKVPADLSGYTEESAKAVTDAINAVDREKTSREQEEVDAMAEAIENALAGLEEKKDVPATDFTLKETSVEVPATKTVQLTPVFTPEDATDTELTWTSSNTKVATVDENGVVTGKVVGKVTITAKHEKLGKTAKCEVRVLFSDVTDKSKAQFEAIYDLVDKGVIAGFKNGEYFAPNDQCTRAQVVLFLWRAAGRPKPKSTKLNFTDAADIQKLAPDYTKAIAWGNEQKIVMGYTGGANKGKFLPNDACTRAQIVLFLYRYKNRPATKTTKLTFTDAAEIQKMAPDYTKAILWANETKVAGGYKVSGGYAFKPNQTCTRGECATFLYRALKLK